MKRDTLGELLAILTAGGRINGEKSRALPASQYGDPANHVKFEREKKLKTAKKLKKHRDQTSGR
jgi:hypothetical protein